MDHASLVALFRRIVLAGPPLLLGAGLEAGCMQFDPCPNLSDVTMTYTASPTDAGAADGGINDLIARCQASSSDCTPLCQHFVPSYQGTIKSCTSQALGDALTVRVVYTPICAGGRCPAGLAPPAHGGARDPSGAWLAASSHLEAASIDAF